MNANVLIFGSAVLFIVCLISGRDNLDAALVLLWMGLASKAGDKQ